MNKKEEDEIRKEKTGTSATDGSRRLYSNGGPAEPATDAERLMMTGGGNRIGERHRMKRREEKSAKGVSELPYENTDGVCSAMMEQSNGRQEEPRDSRDDKQEMKENEGRGQEKKKNLWSE